MQISLFCSALAFCSRGICAVIEHGFADLSSSPAHLPPKNSVCAGGRLAWGCACEMAPAFFRISMHKLNAHTAEQTGLGCFVAPCALFDLDSFTWQLTGVDLMSSLCCRLKGKSNPLFEQHIPSNPLNCADEDRGEKSRPSLPCDSCFLTFYAKIELRGYHSPLHL